MHERQKKIGKYKRGFNSNMVRLDVEIQKPRGNCRRSFNSNMVRLDVSIESTASKMEPMFQFQYGAIR